MNTRRRNKVKAYWKYHTTGLRGNEFWKKMIAEDPRIKNLEEFMEAIRKEFDRLTKLLKHVDVNGMICVGDKTYNCGESFEDIYKKIL